VKKKPFYSVKTRIMSEEVKGLDDLSDERMKTVVLTVRDSTDAKDENEERDRSVVFNAYNLALHSQFLCDILSMTFPRKAKSSDAPCTEYIDFSAIPDDPYSDERSIIALPKGNPDSPLTVDSLKFLAEFVNATEPVEPVGKNFRWFPPESYMEIIYRRYKSIPELMKHIKAANFLGFHSLTHFLASEVAEQLRMYARDKRLRLTQAVVKAFVENEELWTPNHDTKRRALMLNDQHSNRVVDAIQEEMRESEGKSA
jgi:hypothetical protein